MVIPRLKEYSTPRKQNLLPKVTEMNLMEVSHHMKTLEEAEVVAGEEEELRMKTI